MWLVTARVERLTVQHLHTGLSIVLWHTLLLLLLLLQHECVGHGTFQVHHYPVPNIIHRSLVTSDASHTCFHIANMGCAFPLQHPILCIGHWGYTCTTGLFLLPSIAQWLLTTPLTPFYNTMGTASMTFNQYTFRNISCVHFQFEPFGIWYSYLSLESWEWYV